MKHQQKKSISRGMYNACGPKSFPWPFEESHLLINYVEYLLVQEIKVNLSYCSHASFYTLYRSPFSMFFPLSSLASSIFFKVNF